MNIQVPAYNPQAQIPRPYVRFEMRAREDRSSGLSQFVDEAWAITMAPGAKDSCEQLARDWIGKLEAHAREGRVPASWPREYREALEEWERTQTQPVHGTSLKNWPVLSPAQLQNCLNANLLSVEDLATANEQALIRIGMGAVGLKQLAAAWLQEKKGSGELAATVQTLQNALEAAADRIKVLEAALQKGATK